MTIRIDVEEFNRNAKEVFENEVVPQIKKAKEDNMTPVEWLIDESIKLVAQAMTGTLNEDTIEDDVYRIVTKAKEMEKENLESLKDFDTWKEWKNKSEEDE